MPQNAVDSEYPDNKKVLGRRLDKRNLTEEWKSKRKNSAYVWNKKQFDSIDPRNTDQFARAF